MVFVIFFILYKLLKYHSVLVKSIQNFDKMEHHAQSTDDAPIGGLSCKLKPGASYVTNRRSVSYFASGAILTTLMALR